MKILKLTAENIKRLSVVEITPHGSPVMVIAGENEAGKSSVLDAIAMALGGKDLIPSQPIRKGQSRASIRVDLGDYVVTRTFTATGSALAVTNRDGVKFPSPQALLDGLVGKLSFDPLAFTEQEEKVQAATLRRLAHIDTTDIEDQHRRAFDDRTLINRDVKQIEGALAKAEQHEDVGLQLESADVIVEALKASEAAARRALTLQGERERAEHAHNTARRLRSEREAEVERAREALAMAETALMEAEADADGKADAAIVAKNAAMAAAKDLPDREALAAKLSTVEATNAKVRVNQARKALSDDLAKKKREADALTTRINSLESEKADRLANATFPVNGLGLDDLGAVTWNGLPFAQASTAVRIRASVAIGLALNPELKVLLVRNGNDLGSKNLKLLAELAAAAGAQVWVERIAGGDGQSTVVIENGAVAPQPAEVATV